MGKSLTFFKEVRTELSKVSWPSREQTVRLTVMVFGISVFVGIFIGGLDALFVSLITFVVKR
jgi:preprotein translocase subunit SecE